MGAFCEASNTCLARDEAAKAVNASGAKFTNTYLDIRACLPHSPNCSLLDELSAAARER